MARGEPRTTSDVDVALAVALGEEPAVVEKLLERFNARFSDARKLASESRMVLVEASNGVPLDISLACFPFEEAMLRRATRCSLGTDNILTILSSEDLIVHKALAGRDRDWADIQGIFDVHGAEIAFADVCQRLTEIADLIEYETVVHKLTEIRRQALNS